MTETVCRCGHDVALHDGNGVCIALIMTVTAWSAGCGCPEFREQTLPETKK